MRAPVVFYNRSNEAAAQLKAGDFDWAKIFEGGARTSHGRVPHTSRCCLIGPRRCLARLPLVPQRWYLRFPLAHDV